MPSESPLEARREIETPPTRHRTRFVTLVFTDLVDSVALRRQLGDQAATSLMQAHRAAVRQALARFPDADEIETAGDSFLLLFARPSDAVTFALSVQAHTRLLARERVAPLAVRAGIHVGEVVVEEHESGSKARDLYGAQTDLCARVMGLAGGGQILLTQAVFDSARLALKGQEIDGVGPLSWVMHGRYLLKGIEQPVEVGEVGETGSAPLTAPPSTEKARQITWEGEHAVDRPRARVTPRRAALAAAVVVVLALAALLARRGGRLVPLALRTLDPNVVVIAPFTALGEPLSLWREGMMDVLARALDGVGPLRTVSPTLVVRSWEGRADRTSAAELARANGAGLAVFGQLMPVGSDSVRATVTVFDVRGDSVLAADLEVRDALSRMDRLSDSIAVGVFNQIRRVRPIGAAPTAALGSRSLPALKAFLKGEQLYRRGDFAAAQTAYEEAVTVDTTFALAYRRLRNVLRWFGEGPRASKLVEYAHRAGALNHGLGRRDSLLILADSLIPEPAPNVFLSLDVMARSRRRVAALEQAAAEYPNDAEVWTELGASRVRNTRTASGAAGALEAYERAIAADSLFGPAYPNAIPLALEVRGRDAALAIARRYLRINPRDSVRSAIEQVLSGDLSEAELRRAVQPLAFAEARFVGLVLAQWPDSGEAAVRLFRLLAAGSPSALPFVSGALRARGHLRQAPAVPGLTVQDAGGPVADLLFSTRYAPAGAAVLDSLCMRWLADERREMIPIALTRAADRSDTAMLARTLAIAERHSAPTASAGEGGEGGEWRYIASLARAYLLLARGDSSAAVGAFGELADSLAWEKPTMPAVIDAARLLAGRGRGRDALALLDRHAIKGFGINVWKPRWYLEVARAAAIAGDSTRARASYAFAAAAWARADPALRGELDDVAADLRRHGVR